MPPARSLARPVLRLHRITLIFAKYGTITSVDSLGNPTTVLAGLLYFADGTSGLYALNVDHATGGAFADDSYAASGTTTTKNVASGNVYTISIDPSTKIATATAPGTAITDTSKIAVSNGISYMGMDQNSNLVYGNGNSVVFYVSGKFDPNPSVNSLVVTPAVGSSKFMSADALVANASYEALNTANQNVLTAAVSNNPYSTVAPSIVYYTGTYATNQAVVNGATVTTVTYNVYKNGTATTVSYAVPASATLASYTTALKAGFYDTNAVSLGAESNVTYVLNATATTDLYNGTLVIGGQSVLVGSAKIIDLTPTQAYTALVLAAPHVVTVAIDWTLNTVTGVRTANNIYIVSVS